MDSQKDLTKLNESFDTKEEVIRYRGRLLFRGGYVERDYIEAMIQRDNDLSVYTGNFIAIPHGTDEAKEKVLKPDITVAQVLGGANFGAEDNPRVATVLLGIAGIGSEYLEMIQRTLISRVDVDNVIKSADAQSRDETIRLLNNVE